MDKNNESKILIADDSEAIRMVVESILTQSGLHVDIAKDGQEALDMIQENTYDLVLLDIQMPTVDGFEVCRRLRAEEKTKLLPEIVFFSDYEKMEVEGLKLGVADFISKSNAIKHVEGFIARVNAHLRIAQLSRKNIELEKYKTLRATIASVEHEIRNPLVPIGISLEKMKKCPNCEQWYKAARDGLQQIDEALDRLSAITSTTTTNFHGEEMLQSTSKL